MPLNSPEGLRPNRPRGRRYPWYRAQAQLQLTRKHDRRLPESSWSWRLL